MKINAKVLRATSVIAIIFSLSEYGYCDSVENLIAWVKESMQAEMQRDDSYNGISIGEVALVKESSTKFTGFIEFSYGDYTEKPELTVTADDRRSIYKCEPPRVLMLRREEIRLMALAAKDTTANARKAAEKQRAQELAKEDFETAIEKSLQADHAFDKSKFPDAVNRWKDAEATFRRAETAAKFIALPAYRIAKTDWTKARIRQTEIIREEFLKKYSASLFNQAQKLSAEAEKFEDIPSTGKEKYEEATELLNGAINEALKKMSTPAKVIIECNAQNFEVYENNLQLTNSNPQLIIPPLVEYTLEIRAKGYRPQTLTFKAAEPGQDLGVKRVVLSPNGGDPNAVSWEIINERWVRNIYANGAVTMSDLSNSNMWLYDANCYHGRTDWKSAAKYCKNLNYAGYSDWRLPEKDDLRDQLKQKDFFQDVQSYTYWSGTLDAGDAENSAWGVSMDDERVGSAGSGLKTFKCHVWPVRTQQ